MIFGSDFLSFRFLFCFLSKISFASCDGRSPMGKVGTRQTVESSAGNCGTATGDIQCVTMTQRHCMRQRRGGAFMLAGSCCRECGCRRRSVHGQVTSLDPGTELCMSEGIHRVAWLRSWGACRRSNVLEQARASACVSCRDIGNRFGRGWFSFCRKIRRYGTVLVLLTSGVTPSQVLIDRGNICVNDVKN